MNELNPNKHKLLELPKNVKLTHPKEFTHQYTRALAILHDDSEWDLVGGRGITIKLFPGRYAGDGVDWNERKTFWREGFVCKYVPRRAPTPSNPAQKPVILVTAHLRSSDNHKGEIDVRHPENQRKEDFVADALHTMLAIALGSKALETLSKSQVIVLGDFNTEEKVPPKRLGKNVWAATDEESNAPKRKTQDFQWLEAALYLDWKNTRHENWDQRCRWHARSLGR